MKWTYVPNGIGVLRRQLEGTPYFVDRVIGLDGIWYCLYGPKSKILPDIPFVFGWFRLLRDAKAEAERLASERV